MDAQHIHAWEQGNVARALLAGHGFGSPLLSTQPSAIMPPVYPLIVAFFFRVFGIHTAQSIFAIHAFDCLINALACIPVFLLARRSFGPRAALMGGLGLGLLSQRHLLFRSLGLVHAPAAALPALAAGTGAGDGESHRAWDSGPVLACSRASRRSLSHPYWSSFPSCSCWPPSGWRARANAGCCPAWSHRSPWRRPSLPG